MRIVIDLGHQLGLEGVAEGVETSLQLDRLRHFGCDRIQGFHVARPTPATSCQGWLDARLGAAGVIGVASGGGEVE